MEIHVPSRTTCNVASVLVDIVFLGLYPSEEYTKFSIKYYTYCFLHAVLLECSVLHDVKFVVGKFRWFDIAAYGPHKP